MAADDDDGVATDEQYQSAVEAMIAAGNAYRDAGGRSKKKLRAAVVSACPWASGAMVEMALGRIGWGFNRALMCAGINGAADDLRLFFRIRDVTVDGIPTSRIEWHAPSAPAEDGFNVARGIT